jgi:hydroxymethylpyrimidine/phosphomethylpyrimidine kinase
MMKVALTIAASDSSAGAGVQADLAVFREIGVYGTSAITAVTAQGSGEVKKIADIPPRIVAAQIDAVMRGFEVSACKVGMLHKPQTVQAVLERIKRREIPNVVLDPVMKAKQGEVLLTGPAIKRLKRYLLPLVTLVTPNRDEAGVLVGFEVNDNETAREAAQALVEMGAKAALVKGGHSQGEPIDILFDGEQLHEFAGARIDKQMHGTGCVLSAAIAARLALGDGLVEAVQFAKGFIHRAIERSQPLGKGGASMFVGNGGGQG